MKVKNKLLKKGMLVGGFICLLIAGCSNEQKALEFKQRNDTAFKACVDSGGVPMQSWFNETVLSDCIFPH